MATPVGHAIAGLAVSRLAPASTARERWGWAALCVVMANFPDLDFLPGILVGRPALYHQGITHSIAVALLASAAAAAVFRPSGVPARIVFAFGLAAYATHLGVDLFGPDARDPFGIPLLWPASSATFLAPFQVFLGVHHAASTSESTASWLRNVFGTRNLLAVGLEIAAISPFLLAAELVARRRRMV